MSAVVAIVAGVAFTIRQRRARFPLYDLDIAGRRLFWVAAVAGIIVFGSLMAAMFVGQQYLQNVLGYDTLSAGAAILPAAVFMVLAAPLSARLVSLRGSRITLLIGYAFVGLSFVATAVLGVLVLGEAMAAARVAGIALIVAGVVLVGRS